MAKDPDDLRILVVDDDKAILHVFSSLLAQAQLYADFFSTSQKAFAALMTHPKRYDLLITDIYMPDGDGVEFAKKVRQTLPNLPVMFMTGNATEEKKKEALGLGRVDFLEKPFPLLEALKTGISKLIMGS